MTYEVYCSHICTPWRTLTTYRHTCKSTVGFGQDCLVWFLCLVCGLCLVWLALLCFLVFGFLVGVLFRGNVFCLLVCVCNLLCNCRAETETDMSFGHTRLPSNATLHKAHNYPFLGAGSPVSPSHLLPLSPSAGSGGRQGLTSKGGHYMPS